MYYDIAFSSQECNRYIVFCFVFGRTHACWKFTHRSSHSRALGVNGRNSTLCFLKIFCIGFLNPRDPC